MYHRCPGSVSSTPYLVSLNPLTLTATATKVKTAIAVSLLLTIPCFSMPCVAQEQAQAEQETHQPTQAQTVPARVTIPAGTRVALVLTYPVQSRSIHRGDDIYAQITSPVNSGNEVAIPPGTFVQGKVDKLEQKSGRGELHLQSMSITFPNGYVAPISGPVTMQSYEGYALKDPGKGRGAAAIAFPVAGAGLGALIGHSVASSQNSTITNSLPPGCTGPPPGCLSSSLSVPPNKGASTVIGAAVGGAIGMVASIVMLTGSHHFFLDVGAPVEMVLEQAVSLQQDQVAAAIRESEEHPVTEQPVPRRPTLPPPAPTTDHGTCHTPDTAGTPPTVIPGVPGPDGVPGPPTVIPGTPPIPGTPYPCP
jgi:hypothetical protein